MGLNFCTSCGTPLKFVSKYCPTCGSSLFTEASAAMEVMSVQKKSEIVVEEIIQVEEKAPATPNTSATIVEKASQVSRTVNQVISLFGNSAYALADTGEMTFSQTFKMPTTAIADALGPIRYILNSVMGLFRGFKCALKDKKKWIPLLLLTLVWMMVPIVKYFGISNRFIYYISLFTFAEGGVFNGMSGALGGIVGKGIVAGFLIQFFSSLLSFKNPFSGMRRSVGAFFKAFSVEHVKNYSALLIGCGLALIAYNFMVSYTMPQGMMVSVAGMALSMKAVANKSGFLKGLFIAFMSKSKKRKPVDLRGIIRMIAGFSIGFALSIPLSFSGILLIGYMLGTLLCIVGIGLSLIPSKKKGGHIDG